MNVNPNSSNGPDKATSHESSELLTTQSPKPPKKSTSSTQEETGTFLTTRTIENADDEEDSCAIEYSIGLLMLITGLVGWHAFSRN